MTESVIPVDAYLVASLPEVWFGVVMFALGMYLVLDGFDFGIGLLYATRNTEHERETLLSAFGPVWDANEVWLVAFGTMLLAAFPRVYSRLLADHYLLAIGFVLALLFRGLGRNCANSAATNSGNGTATTRSSAAVSPRRCCSGRSPVAGCSTDAVASGGAHRRRLGRGLGCHGAAFLAAKGTRHWRRTCDRTESAPRSPTSAASSPC